MSLNLSKCSSNHKQIEELDEFQSGKGTIDEGIIERKSEDLERENWESFLAEN